MSEKKKRNWNKNRHILKSISNPSKDAYEIKMKIPELTFEGVRGQPDFAEHFILVTKLLSSSLLRNTFFHLEIKYTHMKEL